MTATTASRIPQATRDLVVGGCVLTIGNFDGVHIGHQRLLKAVRREADERGLPAVVLTFEPHPVTVFRSRAPDDFRLTPAGERARILERYGMDHVVTLEFDPDLASVDPEAFVRDLLDDGLQARSVHVGYDFNFGRKRAGNFQTLSALGAELKIRARQHDAVELDGEPVSSTRVRKAIEDADMAEVTRLLGRPYSVEGVSARGAGRGGKIGIPTINLYPAPRLLPRLGVYGTFVHIGGERYPSITNIGSRPTFDDDNRISIETMILDAFEGDAHDLPVRVELLGFIRAEMKFEGPKALKDQIASDVERARVLHDEHR